MAASACMRSVIRVACLALQLLADLWTAALRLYYARNIDVVRRARELRLKVPRHIGLLAPGAGRDSLGALGRLAAECALLGCGYVTVFDSDGSLKEKLRGLAMETDGFLQQRGAPAPELTFTDGRQFFALRRSGGAEERAEWAEADPAGPPGPGRCLVRAIRSGEGHEQLAAEARAAARVRLAGSHANGTGAAVNSAPGGDWPEADLVLLLGGTPSARGFPPPALRFTELAYSPKHGLSTAALLAALLRFSRTTQNYGT
eukprot:tig00000093_g3655.t1